MDAKSQFTRPAIVDRSSGAVAQLESVTLEAAGVGAYNERWLQELLYAHCSLIPIEDIEPVFAGAVPVCFELPLRVGYLDLAFINEQGLLTLVECKLWRNPEARREVVGQILDYAQEISRWSYEKLDAAIKRSEKRAADSLWEIAQQAFGLTDEAAFIDRVAKQLRNGTFLLLIVGDGIRENTENIADFLNNYAGLSFAFGLVEERLFLLPDSDQILVQPRVLAKTVEIGRLILTAEAGVAIEASVPAKGLTTKTAGTLTEALFIEQVAGSSALAEDLRQLFAKLKDEGFVIEGNKSGKSIKVLPPNSTLNLLNLGLNGKAECVCGQTDIGRRYIQNWAQLIPGAQAKISSDGWYSKVVRADGSSLRVEDVVKSADAWLELLRTVRDELASARDD